MSTFRPETGLPEGYDKDPGYQAMLDKMAEDDMKKQKTDEVQRAAEEKHMKYSYFDAKDNSDAAHPDGWASPADYDDGYDPNDTDAKRWERQNGGKAPVKTEPSKKDTPSDQADKSVQASNMLDELGLRQEKGGQMSFLSEGDMRRPGGDRPDRFDHPIPDRAPMGQEHAATRKSMAADYNQLTKDRVDRLTDEQLCALYDADSIEKDLDDDDFCK